MDEHLTGDCGREQRPFTKADEYGGQKPFQLSRFNAGERYKNPLLTLVFGQCPQTSLSYSQSSATTSSMRFSTQFFIALGTVVATVAAAPQTRRGDPPDISLVCTPGV